MKKFIAVAAILALVSGTVYARNAYGRTPAQTEAVLDQSGMNTTIAAANLVTNALQDVLIATCTATGADLASSGTGTITIQLVDSAGSSRAERVVLRTWIGTADDFGADALTDYSVTTGTQKEEVTANAEYITITDTNGVVVMAVDAGGADSVWAWAEVGGRVVESGEVVLTAP